MRFVPPDEHAVLVFLVQIALLLLVARLLGQVCRKFGQPSVIGELAAGVVLGPSVLGAAAPELYDWIFPPGATQSAMLFTVGWIGVLFLLVVTGFETDLVLIKRLGRAVVWVTAGSLLLPFLFGLGGGFAAPASLRGPEADATVFALFLAAALTISSLPVIAKIMSELRLLRRNFGQLTLAVGMANDVIGWVLLGLIAGLVQSGGLELGDFALTLFGLVAFLVAAAVIGQRVVDAALHVLRRNDVGLGGWVTVALTFVFALGAITQALGVEAVLGAFVAGILLGRSRYTRHDVEEHLEIAASSFVAPIFFATAGLRIDLGLLWDAEVALWAAIVLAIASISKFAGSLLGARLARLSWREGAALGVGLNARGALEIVIATVGLSLGVLNDASYTIVVLMAIATSVMAPPLLRLVVRGWEGTPEERERLAREERHERNLVVKPGRVLLPSRGGAASVCAAGVLASFVPEGSPVTLVTVNGTEQPDLGAVRTALGTLDVERVTVHGRFDEQVPRQTGLGYQLLVLGAPRRPDGSLPSAVRSTVWRSRIPTLLVVPPAAAPPPARILVPVAPGRAATVALEVGIAMAERTGAVLVLVHVVDTEGDRSTRRLLRATLRTLERVPVANPDPVGDQVLEVAAARAAESGVSVERSVVTADARSAAIVRAAIEAGADLVVLGASMSEVDGAAFFGRTAERVLETCPTGLVLVTTPVV